MCPCPFYPKVAKFCLVMVYRLMDSLILDPNHKILCSLAFSFVINYLRSTNGCKRLNHVMILQFHKDQLENLRTEEMIEELVDRKE